MTAPGLRFLLILLLGLSSASCLGRDPAALSEGQAIVAPGVLFDLPPPAALGRDLSAVQNVVASYRGETIVLETHLEIQGGRLSLVGLDGLGRRVVSLRYDGKRLQAETAEWAPQAFRPENLVADLAIIYWPLAAVRRGLWGSNAVVDDMGSQRSVVANARELIRIDYENGLGAGQAWNAAISYRNPALGYELRIRSSTLGQ